MGAPWRLTLDSIAFFPTTGVVRTFKSYNLGQEWYHNHPMITRPSEFSSVRRHKTLLTTAECYGLIHQWATTRNNSQPPPHGEETAQDCWEIAWAVGDLVLRPPQQSTVTLPLNKGFNITFDVTLPKDVPKQCHTLNRLLNENRHDFYTKEEMQRFLTTTYVTTALKTRQDPWRIFRYYREVLSAYGVIQENA